MKKLFLFLICCFFALTGGKAWGQNLPFPYDIQVETIAGNCFDDSRAIITLWDAFGNEIVIDQNTHHAADTTVHPFFNVQYHYRNQTAGTNTRYDSLNNIQLSAGTYCFGVVGYVPVTTGGVTTYELVDTTFCGIVVPTYYNHFEASVLTGIAENSSTWDWRERAGIHPAYECADIGRIQLNLRYGNFPYHVQIYDENNQLVRDRYYYQREHNGISNQYADYLDYYTFDSLPAGDFTIIASDSCGYTIPLSVNVPLRTLDYILFQTEISNESHCADTNAISFKYWMIWDEYNKNYSSSYLYNLMRYRFINPGNDTTQWGYIPSDAHLITPPWMGSGRYSTFTDRIPTLNQYCDLNDNYDTVYLQIWDLCQDDYYTVQFVFHMDVLHEEYISGVTQIPRGVTMPQYEYQTLPEQSEQVVAVPDTCSIHNLSGSMTQRHYISGVNNSMAYNWNPSLSMYEPSTYYINGTPFLYTCPLSLDIYTEHDEQLLGHGEGETIGTLVSSFTNPTNTDTSMRVHIVLSDARGCILQEFYRDYEFTVTNAVGDVPYEWEIENSQNYCVRWFSITEKDVDFYQFRRHTTVRLIRSPLYNHFNFTATYDEQEDTWNVVKEDPTNTTTTVTFTMGVGWGFRIEDPFNEYGRYCSTLPNGHYTFVISSDCDIDTITYLFYVGSYRTVHRHRIEFDVLPQFPGVQVCDRYIITPYAVGADYETGIDVNISEDEPFEVSYQLNPEYYVQSGPSGGWYLSGNQIVLTIPGTYLIRTRIGHSSSQCYNGIYNYDYVTYEPVYIDFDMGYAVICDGETSTGNVLTHAINGTPPYQYYLYDHADLDGTLLGTSADGNFYDISLIEGQQVSVQVVDSCGQSFPLNMVVTTLSQSTLAWESGYAPGAGHCEGDSVFLAALPFTQSVTYHWTGPNGFESDMRDNTVLLPYGSESGWYTVEITNTGCQTSFTDSVYIEVLRAPTIDILSDTTLCAGSEIELALVAQSNGTVHYTLHHSGAPQSGEISSTAQAGDTLYQTFPIWGDNLFWVTGAEDERCAYHHTVDTTRVQIYGVESTAASSLHIEDGFACYDYDAVLGASSTLAPPYFVNWYSSLEQDVLLQRDTIWNASQAASLTIPNLHNDTMVYVSLSNVGRCENLYGAIYHTVNMGNGNFLLQSGEGVRFFDSGGESGDYSNNEQLTQTFCGTGQGGLRVLFNALEVISGDTLFVYEGAVADPAHLAAVITHSIYPPELVTDSGCITFHFSSNWVNAGSGWNIDILTNVEMTEVYGYIIPPYIDTVSVEVCQSEMPYTQGSFDSLNISVPGLYTFDSLFIADNGCDSLVHLDLLVKPVSDTILYDSTQYAQLPYTWNGAVFNDFGEQEVTFTNSYNCDSVVHMVLTWTPALEVTYDTVVCESDLPYEWHGVLFTGPDTMTAGIDTILTLQLGVFYPRLSVSPDVTIRTGDTAMLWVTGADHYQWIPSTDLSSDDTDTTYASPERTTVYYVTGSYDVISCTADTFVVVTVVPRNTVDDYVTLPMNLSVEIHPLANDTLSCTDATPTLLSGPHHGTASAQGADVLYQPALDFVGLDTIFYSVVCNDTLSRAYIFLLVQPYPDNVDSADCVLPPAANAWSIRRSAVSTVTNAVTVSVPVVIDYDGDNEQEVLIPQTSSGTTFRTVGVYKADGSLETQISVAASHIWNTLAVGKVQTAPGVYASIVVVFGTDKYLYAYDYAGTQLWRSNQPFSSHNGESVTLPAVSFADFNHDGWSEVFIGGEIYDAATGVLLCKADGNTGHARRNWDNGVHTYQSAAADLTGDFGLDLAAGNTLYHVNLQSRTNFASNSMEVAVQVDSADLRMSDNSVIPFTDGNTFMVDINLDGRLDVVVMNVDQDNHVLYLYVWDTGTGEIICSKKIPNSTKFGAPQIGDIDRDGAPEVCFIVGTAAGHSTGSNDLIYALKYNAASSNREMDIFWTMSHSDNSGSTGLTLFDFNQDGYTELVYRDLANLRIINGSLVDHETQAAVAAPYDLATIACASATGIEYPIVADVDLDGEAEIVVSGASTSTDFGYLYFFKSDGSAWAPARHVWNQFAYNLTNVNDDGSIPLYLFNNAALLPDRYNPSEWHRPFNNFLQQGTSIDRYGEPYATVPDVAVTGNAAVVYYSDSVAIEISYCNEGDNVLNAPYEITVYQNSYRDTALWVATVEAALPVDSCVQYRFSLPQEVICTHRSLTDFVVAVNDGGFGVAQNGGQQGECDTLNNFATMPVTIAHDTTYIFDTIVENQLPYTVAEMVFESAGTDETTLTNRHGCDSTVIVDLFVWPNVSTHVDSTICDDALPFTWNGRTFTQAGSDSAIFVAHSGADSVVYMTVYVNPTHHTLLSDTICQGESYTLNHFSITSPETDTHGHSVHYQYLTNRWQCDSTVELHLFVAPVPQPEFVPDPEQMLLSEGGLFIFHNATDLTTLTGETYQWHWDFGDGSSDNTAAYDYEHTYTTWGEFLVTLSLEIYGCEASVSHSVYIEADLQFPNVITPNGDGKNDVFAIINLDVDRPNKLDVYNRWGKKVFGCDNYQTYARDGVIYNEDRGFSADNLSDGVYYYSFRYQGRVRTVEFHGTITVIR